MSVADLLAPEELAALAALSRFHADGWGIAAGAEVLRRSTAPAWHDPDFERHLGATRCAAGILHLRRASTGYAVASENTHPFVREGWAFAHNGTIAGEAGLDSLLEPRWAARRRGSTDSERYFLAFLQRLEASGEVLAAMRSTVSGIRSACGANGLNAVACSEGWLVAVQASAGAAPTLGGLLELMGERVADPGTGISPEHLADYFGLRYRLVGESVVVASTGAPGASWSRLTEDSVLVVDRSRSLVEVHPLIGSGEGPLWRAQIGAPGSEAVGAPGAQLLPSSPQRSKP